ncbi:PepSY-associated TM helix domain-containing protein [Xylophilus sp.]|uniref:PepSY-associated TM helix domain-containing protein n=1 Tax=Xylophilus sp. TaxID=2653893 RepID=UPI002D807FA5|nr:PepSY-associated TM helix domain-containing protein [Xylophilus sp.]
MAPRTPSRFFRANLWLHRWCSLVATLPFLILCLSGTVLVFHEEIDAALGHVPAVQPGGAAHRPLQESIDNLLAAHAGERVASVGLDAQDHPGVLMAAMVPGEARKFENTRLRYAELATARPTAHAVDPAATLTGFLLELHARWFLGMVGELIGAVIALLVLVSLVSGLVVYWPHAKKVAFGLLRRGRGPRLRQLDLHNFIGVVVLGWAFAVSLTGVLLGLGTVATGLWTATALGELRGQVASEPVDVRRPPVPLDAAVAAVERRAPAGWKVGTVIYPGTEYSTPRHYAVLVRAPAGLESRLFRAGLVDAGSGEVAALLEMPWYMQAIVLSQPLHFGDYGGLPLKLLWTLSTWLTLYITANGAWMWWDRRRGRSRPAAAAVRTAAGEAAP